MRVGDGSFGICCYALPWLPKGIIVSKPVLVAFQDAATVFGDPLALTFSDPQHSIGEHRQLTFGTTPAGKHVVVAHIELESSMRIISARTMTKQERRIYEKG